MNLSVINLGGQRREPHTYFLVVFGGADDCNCEISRRVVSEYSSNNFHCDIPMVRIVTQMRLRMPIAVFIVQHIETQMRLRGLVVPRIKNRDCKLRESISEY